MKNLIQKTFLTLHVLLIINGLSGQTITTTLTTSSICAGEVYQPVSVANCNGIAAFSLVCTYNTALLSFLGYSQMSPALAPGMISVSAANGRIYMAWSSSTAVNVGTETLLRLKFQAIPGNAAFAWDTQIPGNCEYSDINGAVITSSFVNGSMTIYAPPQITTNPASKTISAGSNTTFSASASGQSIVYRWQQSEDMGSNWVDIVNGGNFSNSTTPTLTVSSAPLSMSGRYFRCRISGTCEPVVFTQPAVLTVLPLVTTIAPTSSVCPGEVVIPITVNNFIKVGAFSMALNYNVSTLSFTGYRNLNPLLSGGLTDVNAANGKVYISWARPVSATLTNGATVLELLFNGTAGNSSLSWDTQTPGNCEYSDSTGTILFSTWTNGALTIYTQPSITTQPVAKSVPSGTPATFNITAAGQGVNYQWQSSADNGNAWANLSNASPYSGVTTAALTVNPTTSGMSGYLYRCRVGGTCQPAVYSNPALLTVTPPTITTTLSNISNSCKRNLIVPVQVTNANNLGSISLTLIFDPSKVTYDGYQSLHDQLTVGFMQVNQSANKLYFSWASLTPATIGSGKLVEFRFRASAGISTTLSWDNATPGNCEYATISGTVVNSTYTGASVSVVSNPLLADAGSDVITLLNNPVQLNGTATGGTPPYSFSWTPLTGLSSGNIANPVALPPTTTVYTFSVSTPNGCVASDPVVVTVTYSPPLVTTLPVTGILKDSATCGGIVTTNNGSEVTGRGICWSTEPDPMILNDHTQDGTGNGAFTSVMSGLTPSTVYFVRAYATNSGGTGYGSEISFITSPEFVVCPDLPVVSYLDEDYPTIKIGEQCWLRKNLNVGTRINGAQEQSQNGIIEKYCYDDLDTNCEIYGGLYQWNEMMLYSTIPGIRGLCPEGWHLPTDADWCEMFTFVDPAFNCNFNGLSGAVAGGKIRESGLSHWNAPNTGATNASGFTALPGGERMATGSLFHLEGLETSFWSSSGYSPAEAWRYRATNNEAGLFRENASRLKGFSVRCVKDTCSEYSAAGVMIETLTPVVCEGAEITFAAVAVNAGLNPQFQWFINNNRVPGAEAGTFSCLSSTGDSVKCILISSAGCISGNPATSNTIVITVIPPPAPPSGYGTSTICETGLPFEFHSLPPSGCTTDWYNQPSGGTLLLEGSNFLITQSGGTFYAESRNLTNGCKSVTRSAFGLSVMAAIDYFMDGDSDGYGHPGLSITSCSPIPGYVPNNTDCDDSNPLVHELQIFFIDNDGDGFGSQMGEMICASEPPEGYSANQDDCDDDNPSVYPGSSYFAFTGNSGFSASFIAPQSGSPYTTFRIEADYFDQANYLPPASFPRLILDYEGNGNFTDPLDRTIILIPDDIGDITTTDGKRYVGSVEALPYGTSWTLHLSSTSGICETVAGPYDAPDVLMQPNLTIFANDISFSNSHPQPGEQITVSATIHNNSDFTASTFTAHLVNQFTPSTIYPDLTIPSIPPQQSVTIEWLITTPSVACWCPVRIWIDYNNNITESNEFDNTAIRPFLNGNYQLPGSIGISAGVTPQTSCVYNYQNMQLDLQAWYSGTAIPLPDSSVAGATIFFRLLETNQTFTGYTDQNGTFFLSFPKPSGIGTFHIEGEITDYTLTGEFSAVFNIDTCVPEPPLPDYTICVDVQPTVIIPAICSFLPYTLVGAPVNCGAIVSNIGETGATVQTVTNIALSGSSTALVSTTTIPLAAGQSDFIPAEPLVFTQPGIYQVNATADATGILSESNEYNNSDWALIRVLPDKPDIIPVSGPFWFGWDCLNLPPCFTLYNGGGIPTGPFTCEITISRNSTVLGTFLPEVSNIDPLCYYTVCVPFLHDLAGTYSYTIQCDVGLGINGVVDEWNENNNSAGYTRQIYECQPNLSFLYCYGLDVDSESPVFNGNGNLIARIMNTGIEATPGPVKVKFDYAPGPGSYLGTTDGALLPGQIAEVRVSAPLPPPATTLLTATIDPLDEIPEYNETDNAASDSMCWELQATVPCGLFHYWNRSYEVNDSVVPYMGVILNHLYDGHDVTVRFEVLPPGASEKILLGDVVLEKPGKNCFLCPYFVSFSDFYHFDACGTYLFTVTVDPGNLYHECNESNNVLDVAVNVNCPSTSKPNLKLSYCGSLQVQPVNPPYPGGGTLIAKVLNTGLSEVTGPVTVRFSLSSGEIWHAQYGGSIPSGHSADITAQIPLPPPATTELTAMVDPYHEIAEFDETDNTASGQMCWEFQPVPRCGKNFWERSYLLNQSAKLSVGLQVSHLYESNPVKVKFLVSGPGITGTQNLGEGFLSNARYNCYYCPYIISLPAPFIFSLPGTYTFTMIADPDNQFPECIENNNTMVVTITIPGTKPDMRILSQHINPSMLNPAPNQLIDLDISYENIGNSNISDQMRLKVKVDTSWISSVYPVSGLASGDHTTIPMPQTWSSDLPGLHIIRAIIDADQQIAELNESNNEATRAIIVGDAANLSFFEFNVSDTTPGLNQPVTIHSLIQNTGNQPCTAELLLQMIDDNGDTMQIGRGPFMIGGFDTIALSLPWFVNDTATTLIGSIINTSVPEFNEEDNTALLTLGGFTVEIFSSPGCQGFSDGWLTATAMGGVEPYLFEWSNGTLGPTLVAEPGTYTVDVYDMTGLHISASDTLMVYPSPTGEISGQQIICQIPSAGTQYQAVTGMINYQWSLSGGGTIVSGQGTSQIVVTWTTPGNHTVWVTYTSPSGCQPLITPNLSVQVSQQPGQAGTITGPAEVTLGQSGLIYSVLPVEGATGYVWSLPEGFQISAGANTPSITVNILGNATSGDVSVMAINGCGTGTASPPLEVLVYLATPNVINIFSQTIIAGRSVCYNATQSIFVAGYGNVFTVQPTASVEMIAGMKIVFSPSTRVLSGGYLHAHITTNGQFCGALKTMEISAEVPDGVDTSVAFSPASGKYKVYPNPTTGELFIEPLEGKFQSLVETELFDLPGNRIYHRRSEGSEILKLSLRDQKPGLYLLKITTTEGIDIVKIIRQ